MNRTAAGMLSATDQLILAVFGVGCLSGVAGFVDLALRHLGAS